MAGKLKPDMRVASVTDIDPETLAAKGISGILVDLDNTLVPWRSEAISEAVTAWVSRIKQAGIKMAVLSNAGGHRASRTSKELSLPVIAPAKKPLRSAYVNGLRILGTEPEKTAMIGDQLFMDIWGAKKAGLTTILVDPISRREFAGTRLLRILERRLL